MKKMLGLFLVAITALVLVGCGSKEVEATGYGLVHKSYVGEVTVTVDKKGIVTKAHFEEYYLADHAATVKAVEGEREDVIVNGAKSYAKYFAVDGKVFVASIVDEKIEWKNETAGELKEWVKTEANAKAYVEAVKAGKVFIANADGSKNTELEVIGNAAVDMSKSLSNYGGERWDWKAAMKGLEEIIIGTSVDFKKMDRNDDKKWVVDGDVTSATLVDFKDYIAVAKRAVANAK